MSCKENKNAHERSGDNSFCLSITTPYIQDNNNEVIILKLYFRMSTCLLR